MNSRPSRTAPSRRLGRWVVRRRRLAGLTLAGLLLMVVLSRTPLVGAWGAPILAGLSLAVAAVAATAYRLITHGSGRDLGLCPHVGWRPALTWILVVAAGAHAIHRLEPLGASPPPAAGHSTGHTRHLWGIVSDVLTRRTANGEGLSTTLVLLVAMVLVVVTGGFVMQGMIHRGVRDSVIGSTGRPIAVFCGIAVQLALLAALGVVPTWLIPTAAFVVVISSIAYEFTGALWVPVVGQVLHGALCLTLPGLGENVLGLPAVGLIVAVVLASASAFLASCSLGRLLGTRIRIAAVP